jgi:hypothetical protein
LVRGRPGRPVRGGASSCRTEVTFSRHVQVTCGERPRSCSPTWAASRRRARGGRDGGRRPLRPAPARTRSCRCGGTPQPGQHRQAYRPGQERQLHDDSGDHPAITEPDRLGSVRGAVVRHATPNTLSPERLHNLSSTTTVLADPTGSNRSTIGSTSTSPPRRRTSGPWRRTDAHARNARSVPGMRRATSPTPCAAASGRSTQRPDRCTW